MKKTLIFGSIGVLLIVVLVWLGMKNKQSGIQYDTEKPYKATIVNKTVATGIVTPLEEIEIKPQISGIVDKI
ncbi:MAG: efflux transporter periplasmic adaptor subunit, partial [Flavobacteriaceae bacterium]|nr:efflux transporter periplasmic adaptor subunit [Flavobacteriaceae bacterium]